MNPETIRPPGYLINRSARLMTRWGEERFHALGLAIAQMPVLVALKSGASLTQKELAALAQVEQPTMTHLLARMERDGLIRRSPNPGDKRSSLISLTPTALEKLPGARQVLLEGGRIAMQGFTDEEVETLSQLLRRVIQNLDPTAAGAEP